MNIFVTDTDPYQCAKALDDLRVNKMILESAQMLCTALRYYGVDNEHLYKKAHINHPCTIWTRKTRSNYRWLFDHFCALYDEKVERTGKGHASYTKLYDILKNGINLIPDGPLTEFSNCTTYKDVEDVYEAYRLFMADKWENDKRPPKWYGVER